MRTRLGFNPLSDRTVAVVKWQLGQGKESISKNNYFDSLARHAVRAGGGGGGGGWANLLATALHLCPMNLFKKGPTDVFYD